MERVFKTTAAALLPQGATSSYSAEPSLPLAEVSPRRSRSARTLDEVTSIKSLEPRTFNLIHKGFSRFEKSLKIAAPPCI